MADLIEALLVKDSFVPKTVSLLINFFNKYSFKNFLISVAKLSEWSKANILNSN